MASAAQSSRLLDQECTFSSLCDELDLDVRIKKGIARLGYIRPTLVQRQCLTLGINQGRDLLVRARTGSGKTLAYCIPILQKILIKKNTTETTPPGEFVKAVILVPTRELCDQVYSAFKGLMYYCDEVVNVAVLGGAPLADEEAKFRALQQEAMLRDKPDVVVSTPAGLWRLVKEEKLILKNSVETLVVDEADLVLSFGYAKDVEQLARHLPQICQGFLMSATLTPELDSLKKVVLHSPAILKLEEEELPDKHNALNLSQFYLALPKKDKKLVIYVFLKLGLLKGKGLFFVNSIDGAFRLKLFLEQFHIRSHVLNAELPLTARLNILDQFNVGNFDYLIATDEASANTTKTGSKKGKKRRASDSEYGASRGLDFQGVSFVVNYDFPISPESYTHRVGRTARGNAKGVAISFVDVDSEEEQALLEAVQASQPPLPITEGTNGALSTVAPTSRNNNFINELTHVAQPSMLDFNLKDVEGFRYRVEDVGRAVTGFAVQEARAAEVKAEVLNSEKLRGHFADNPHDLHILRHDRHVNVHVLDHLKHVPNYLLPKGMQVANVTGKRRKKRRVTPRTSGPSKDPLRSFDGTATLDGVADASAHEEYDDADEDNVVRFEADDDNHGGNKQNWKKSQQKRKSNATKRTKRK